MAAIEATEEAKRKRASAAAAKQTARSHGNSDQASATMTIPGNYNANFHHHRRENAIAKRDQGPAHSAARTMPGGKNSVASDASSYGRFVANERNKRR